MKGYYIKLPVILLFVVLAHLINAEESKKDAAIAALKGFDTVVDKALKDFNVPGAAIGVVVDGHVVLSRGYGLRDVDKELPVTSETLFAIGSSSKAFTTAVLGSLVDEGLIEWDKPVITYMPDFRLQDKHATHNMTVRDLVTHKSGLPRHDFLWYNSSKTREELFSRLGNLEPNVDLRERFQYQNLMFLTAGLLVERVTGESWEVQVKKRIFQLLQMKSSNFSVHASKKDEDHAMPYKEEKRKIVEMDFRDISTVGPAGSINSNINDMTNWLIMQLTEGKFNDKQVLSASVVKDMQTPQMIVSGYPTDKNRFLRTYGLGWFIESYRGNYLVHHGGNIDGFSAIVSMMPMEGIGIVVLTNKNGTRLRNYLPFEIYDRLLGLESGNWLVDGLDKRNKTLDSNEKAEEQKGEKRVAGTNYTHKLKDYVGKYSHDGYGVINITQERKNLVFEYNNIRAKLEHWHHNVFNSIGYDDDKTLEDNKIQFRLNMDGDIAELMVPMEVRLSPRSFKRLPDDKLRDHEYLKKFIGAYSLPNQDFTIELKGATLYVNLPGQPVYELVPVKGTTFNLKGLTGFSVEFVEEGSDINMVKFIQPNGIFEAKRKNE